MELLKPDPSWRTLEVDGQGLRAGEHGLAVSDRGRGVALNLVLGSAFVSDLRPDPRHHVGKASSVVQFAGVPRKDDLLAAPGGRVQHEQLPGDGIENRDATVRAAVPQGHGHQQRRGGTLLGARQFVGKVEQHGRLGAVVGHAHQIPVPQVAGVVDT